MTAPPNLSRIRSGAWSARLEPLSGFCCIVIEFGATGVTETDGEKVN